MSHTTDTAQPPVPPPVPPPPPPPPPPPVVLGPSIKDDVVDGSMMPDGWSFSIATGEGNDFVNGSRGNDTISGGLDNDLLFGNAGSDSISGGPGNDLMIGGPGPDILSGGSGDDFIVIGLGDVAIGGPGADRFVFRIDDRSGEVGTTLVTDFNPAEGDQFWFENPGWDDSIYELLAATMLYGSESGNVIAVLGIGSTSWDGIIG